MPILIIGWRIYDKLSEQEQKVLALVERYRTASSYEYAKRNKDYEWSDRCFKTQEELLQLALFD